jgi:hypothetical protein
MMATAVEGNLGRRCIFAQIFGAQITGDDDDNRTDSSRRSALALVPSSLPNVRDRLRQARACR